MPRQNKPRFAVIRSRFNAPITKALLEGALVRFATAGIAAGDIMVVEVPGSFELPLAALWLAKSRKYAAVVCLGCVIRGETPHFDYVAAETARGISAVAIATGVPVIFGVLTTDNEAQALDRVGALLKAPSNHTGGPAKGNKGYEAAQAALEMADLHEKLSKA